MTGLPAVAALRKARAWQPWINCFVTIDDTAGDRAEQLAAVDQSDADSAAPVQLRGIPVAYKDAFVVSGRIPGAGSRVKLAQPTARADVERILSRSGTVTIGTLHLDEFSYAATGRSEVLGDCRNPWNLEHATGGSSSGAAAAVAARIVPLAIGTDTGGSVRLPAAWCGVLGFKPTFGTVSTAGIVPLSPSQDTVGLLSTDVELLRQAYHALLGNTLSRVRPRRADTPHPPAGLRIGRPTDVHLQVADEDALAGLHIAEKALGDLGAALVETELAYMPACDTAAAVVTASEAAALHGRLLHDHAGAYQLGTRTRLRVGQLLSAGTYVDALRYRSVAIRRAMAETFTDVDVVLTPVAPSAAPKLTDLPPPSSPGLSRNTKDLLFYTRTFNYLGFPSISVPVGFTEQGLPLAVQLTAAPHADDVLLNVAQALQDLFNWSSRQPQLPSPANNRGRRPFV
ncbi:MAG TPA: amidase [Micromonospora sp.]|nr:amidase [Micromonospora sp.]